MGVAANNQKFNGNLACVFVYSNAINLTTALGSVDDLNQMRSKL